MVEEILNNIPDLKVFSTKWNKTRIRILSI